MSTVPYTFAGDTGNIPLSQLDTNFANVKLSVDYVIQPAQANITSVGSLTSLSVSGNVLANAVLSVKGNVLANSHMTVNGNVLANSNLSVVGNTVMNGNLLVTGTITASANTFHTNVLVSGLISAVGNITGGNLTTPGLITATGNILTAGIMSSTGNGIHGNILTAGIVSATGNITGNVVVANIITAPVLNSADVSLSGNLIVAGNAQVNGTTTFINTTNLNITDKNITIANGVSTSTLIDGAGIDAGNPTVAYIRYSHASQGWTTANSFNIGTTLSVTGNATLSGNTTLSGVSTAPTPANSVANTQIATTLFVRNIIPTGVITLWYGSIASIPDGWYLCDGSNGTPDLRDRFVVGAGSTYAVAATGGNANAVVVQHNHTATSVVTDPGHSHDLTNLNLLSDTVSGGGITILTRTNGTSSTSSNTTGITVATTTANAGVSGTDANLPPYYALAYIMKA